MRRSFFCVFDNEFRTVYFPPELEGVRTYGRYPWEFAAPEYVEMIKESFRECRDTHTNQFHVVKLNEEANNAGCLCVWLTPVALNSGCSLYKDATPKQLCNVPCASIIAKIVQVPEEFHLLTPRERDILAKLGAGVCQNDIATECDIARSTVDTLIQRVRKKFEVETSLQVAVWSTTYRDILELDSAVCRDYLYKV